MEYERETHERKAGCLWKEKTLQRSHWKIMNLS